MPCCLPSSQNKRKRESSESSHYWRGWSTAIGTSHLNVMRCRIPSSQSKTSTKNFWDQMISICGGPPRSYQPQVVPSCQIDS
ncbi:hypothetical protein EYC80_010913 [Monilinia laxa]|uniref:Uncharacterized protein n=1 Tax=Monilinia laxa TaxID=61186 RepID=A0A5N6JSG9_MONLA|nr:hypothetical protein EYC80_010913 [Monilinia laxa]